MEGDPRSVGVPLVFSADGEEHVERVIVAAVKVILDRMVKVKGEGVAGLVAVGKGEGGGAVGTPAIVPLNAVGRHDVPRNFVLHPKA